MRHSFHEEGRGDGVSDRGFVASAVKKLFGGKASDSSGDEGFAEIGRFLAQHGLSATPQNYHLIYRVLIDRDPQLSAAMADLVALGEVSDKTVGELAADGQAVISAETLSNFVTRAQSFVSQTAKIIDESHSSVKSFGEDLETNMASAGENIELPQGLAEQIVTLTKAMIVKSRRFEYKLKRMDSEIGELRMRLDDARKDAMLDPLTGLPNRRAFLEQFEAAVARAGTHKNPLCVAYCDIDHFKGINDSYGHAVGDRVIQFIARRLDESTTDTMYAARFGGEEFVLLFENTKLQKAIAHMETLRVEIGERRLVCRDSGEPIGKITFSVGLAALQGGLDGTGLLKAADQALYRAKELGRDRVETLLSQAK